MNQPPLNPDALADVARMRDMVAEGIDNPGESVHDFVSLPDLYQLLDHLAVAQPVVNSVEQWDALPIGTMVRVHFNGNSDLIIRCPAGSGAGIGGMSFIGGRHWSDVFTVWNADKLEIKCVPVVES